MQRSMWIKGIRLTWMLCLDTSATIPRTSPSKALLDVASSKKREEGAGWGS